MCCANRSMKSVDSEEYKSPTAIVGQTQILTYRQADRQTDERLELSHDTPPPALALNSKAATQHAMLSVYRL